ncbi:transposase [Streptomyces sp. NPDC014636]|uniref:transposase n=1 Tax=Streptomyces sp. NPDC014636 TaxID=3364876 RepID=UPI0036FAFB96
MRRAGSRLTRNQRTRVPIPVSTAPTTALRIYRRILNGMVFKIRTGITWRDPPERYGPWKTVHTQDAPGAKGSTGRPSEPAETPHSRRWESVVTTAS